MLSYDDSCSEGGRACTVHRHMGCSIWALAQVGTAYIRLARQPWRKQLHRALGPAMHHFR